MLHFLLKRLGGALVVLAIVAVLVFLLHAPLRRVIRLPCCFG